MLTFPISREKRAFRKFLAPARYVCPANVVVVATFLLVSEVTRKIEMAGPAVWLMFALFASATSTESPPAPLNTVRAGREEI